jgi:hypothetical protein
MQAYKENFPGNLRATGCGWVGGGGWEACACACVAWRWWALSHGGGGRCCMEVVGAVAWRWWALLHGGGGRCCMEVVGAVAWRWWALLHGGGGRGAALTESRMPVTVDRATSSARSSYGALLSKSRTPLHGVGGWGGGVGWGGVRWGLGVVRWRVRVSAVRHSPTRMHWDAGAPSTSLSLTRTMQPSPEAPAATPRILWIPPLYPHSPIPFSTIPCRVRKGLKGT